VCAPRTKKKARENGVMNAMSGFVRNSKKLFAHSCFGWNDEDRDYETEIESE